jgi:hypothetical protein
MNAGPDTAAVDALTPPADVGAERGLLGAALNFPDALAVALRLVRPEDFCVPEHARLFAVMAELAAGLEGGERLCLVTLEGGLRAAGVLEGLGGRAFLVDLSESYPTAANIRLYCQIVRRKAAQREALAAGVELARQATAPDADLSAVVAEARTRLERAGQRAQDGAIYMTAADLLANCRDLRESIIDGWLRRGEVGNLAAPPKWNKSMLLLNIAVSLGFGRDVLGFPCRQSRVLLIDYELAPGTLAHRLHAVLAALGHNDTDIGDRLAVQSLRGRRLDIGGLLAYFDTLPPKCFDAVLIDPLYRTYPVRDFDENSNSRLAEHFAVLQEAAERLDAAVLVVHHLTKGDQSLKSISDLGAGGGSQSRAADAHLAIRPHREDDAAVLGGVVRSFPPFKAFVMRWRWPLWERADDLDPADLKRPAQHRTAAKTPREPPPPPWTPERFAEAVLTDTPQTKATVLDVAIRAGVPNLHQAGGLLDLAETTGKAFRWRMPKDKRVFYAAKPQPTLAEA